MWVRAMMWPVLFAILFLALACLATPTISGWPEFIQGLDEKVNISTWEVAERAGIICK